MRTLALLLLGTATSFSVEVPSEILRSILHVETRSYVDANENLVYIDKKVGSAGEFGPYQMTEAAYRQIYKGRRPRSDIKYDMQFATELATKYLEWLYVNFAKGNWHRAIEYYNAGPRNKSTSYLRKVLSNIEATNERR